MTWLQRLAVIGGCLTLLQACRDDRLRGTTSALRFDPATVTFDASWLGGPAPEAQVTVVNDGPRTLPVTWSGLDAPFAGALPEALVPGATRFPVHLAPTATGTFTATLTVQSDGVTPALGTLVATVNATPVCTPSSPCVTAHFDPVRGACVEDVVADGTGCDPGTRCLQNARCEAGRCVGDATVCEDGNACTIDVCYPKTGCEFLPAPPCPGDGLCQQGVCDPASGCGLQPREDGSACGGSTGSCTAVDVCIAGSCVTRDPPDGYVCAEASPCQGEGRCANDVCVRSQPVALTLRPSWTFDAMNEADPDAGYYGLHDFVLESSGAMTLSGFFTTPSHLRANTEAATWLTEGARRCILWGQRYVCADYPGTPSGQISGIELSTGATQWTFSIRDAAPQFLPLVSTIFLARIVVQSADRLAAVYEAYPASEAGGATQCRRYFLAVIDASGNLVQAQQVSDPLLEQCNHPHPYGVAADAQGNLFIAFSPTVSDQAPLVPDTTTLIMSWSRDGVFRWKHLNEGMRGGELAVARGLLYAEYTDSVVEAVNGTPAFTVASLLGRAVVSESRLIPAPHEGGTRLVGYEAGTNTPRWTAVLPGASTFWSDQLRLASWLTSKGPRTVALTWVQDASLGLRASYRLTGFDVFDGSEAFSCPVEVNDRTPPQLFEVAVGSLGVMGGALDLATGLPGCNKCDPPLAYGAGFFSSLPTPLLRPASEPWVGTFGGPGHDHREN